MAGAPPPCNPPANPPAGAVSVTVDWYRIWPIIFSDNAPISAFESTLLVIHTTGGTVMGLHFYDAKGAEIPGDWCASPPPVVVPPPPAPPPPPVPPPMPDPGDDELGINFNILFTYLTTLINLIQYLTTKPGEPAASSECCRNVVHVLTNLVLVVEKIEARLSLPGAPPPPPINLTAVITELKCVCTQLTAISSSSATVATDLAPGLKSIADAIASAKPTDLKPVVDALNKIYKTIDVPIGVYQNMADRGLISPQLLQAISTGEFGAGAVSVIVDFVKTGLTWLLAHVGIGWTGTSWSVSPLINSIAHVIDIAVQDALTTGAAPLYPAIRGIIDGVVATLQPTKLPTIGTVYVDPDLLVAKTLAPITIINGVMVLASYFGWELSEHLREYVDLAAEFVGLQEVRELKVGQMMKYGPMREAEMRAKGTYRQELPGYGTLADWSARGILPETRYRNLTGAVGLPMELIDPSIEAAHTGLQPFILLRLAGTGLFTDRDLVDEMTFRGVRSASQHRILLAAPYVATQKERDALRGTLEKGYAQGFFADADFNTRIEQIEHITDKPTLIMDRVRLERAFDGAKRLEKAYETEFLAGITDVPQYQSKLAGIGLQHDYVAYLMAESESHANARLVRQAAAAERALVRATVAEERRAALTQYQAGTIDESKLAGLLIGTGLTPLQAAAWIAQATGQRAGKLRLQFGLRLSPAEATLLRQKVADLTKQRELQMLTDAQYVAALVALKIPPTFVNALRAGANAALKPKTAAILTPVAT